MKVDELGVWVSNDQHPQELWCGDVYVDAKACLGR